MTEHAKRLTTDGLTAMSAVLVALVVKMLSGHALGQDPWLLLLGAVMLSAYARGTRGGVIALTLSSLAVAYLYLPPDRSFAVGSRDDVVRLAVWTLEGIFISLLGGRMRAAVARHAVAEDSLRRTGADLERRVEERTRELAEKNQALEHEISARGKLEAELRQSEEKLREAEKLDAAGRIAGGFAHDFNNLLSIILSYSAVFARDKSLTPSMRTNMEEVAKAAQRAAEITHRLLAFSRSQMLTLAICEPNKLVVGMEAMIQRALGELNVLTLRLDAKGTVKIDGRQMELALLNLVMNARDAMPQGGTLTIATADVDVDEALAAGLVGLAPGPHVQLAVSDTGTGMDAKTRARVFEPFFTTKPRGLGTGLGLSTTFGVVKQCSGAIALESAPGAGTRFSIYFPTVTGDTESVSPSIGDLRVVEGSETVLVVDDDASVRRAFVEVLRQGGYRVLEAATGELALDVLREHAGDVDLLLTDVVMPGLNGHELANRVRAAYPEIRVLFMSGYTADVSLRVGLASHFLQKPIPPNLLLHSVRAALDTLDVSAAPLD